MISDYNMMQRIVYQENRYQPYGNLKKDPFSIKKVIFNDPATIVYWEDGTKTVVKAQEGDEFDPEKGLAMAISKKALGNKGNYNNVIRHWIGACYEKPVITITLDMKDLPLQSIRDNIAESMKALRKTLGLTGIDD